MFNWAHFFIAVAIKGLAGMTTTYLSSSTTSIFHRRITISLLFCDTVAAIFTGLALLEEYKEDGWMLKVMGGFVTWEALIYVLQDLNRAPRNTVTLAFTKLF